MRKLLILTMLCAPFFSSAQKLLKPDIDKISGDTTFTTSKDKIYLHGNYLTQQGEGVESQVMRSGKTIVLFLYPQTMNEKSVFTVQKGQKAYLKFKDNTMVALTCNTFKISDTHVGEVMDNVYSSGKLEVPYVLSDDDIAKIKAGELAFLRIETSEGNFDCEIKDKFSHVISKQVTLITNGK